MDTFSFHIQHCHNCVLSTTLASGSVRAVGGNDRQSLNKAWAETSQQAPVSPLHRPGPCKHCRLVLSFDLELERRLTLRVMLSCLFLNWMCQFGLLSVAICSFNAVFIWLNGFTISLSQSVKPVKDFWEVCVFCQFAEPLRWRVNYLCILLMMHTHRMLGFGSKINVFIGYTCFYRLCKGRRLLKWIWLIRISLSLW